MNRFLASTALFTTLTTGSVFAQTADSLRPQPESRCAHWTRAAVGDVSVSIGFNALTGSEAPALKPLGSRYVALGYGAKFRLSEGRHAAFKLRTGLEVSWYTLMLDDDRLALQTPNGVAFPDAGRQLDKSKLTAAYLNLPLMPTLSFQRGIVQSVGAGGYVGMRLDSYSKVKEEGGRKDRDHGAYALNNFRYGLAAEVNFRHALTFFAQYDLNPLFRAGQGPDTRAFSFGIRL